MFRQKSYYRKLDAILDRIGESGDSRSSLAGMIDQIIEAFSGDLGITSGRLYSRDGSDYLLAHSTSAKLEGLRIPSDYPPVKTILENRIVTMDESFPGYDPAIEAPLNLGRVAAFSLSRGFFLVSFGLDSSLEEESQLFALSTIRHILSLRLRQAEVEEEIDRAEAIQLSLLPQKPPVFAGFDLASRSEPAEAQAVGGDFHDFIELSEHSLGIALGDASGHGLPAALQARDAVTGLRMGVEREFKITAVIRRLNRVIHASNLSTRFVSLFYGELESNGNLIYVNAGHCLPLLLDENGELHRLDTGGTILGPTPDADYQRGFVTMNPGSRVLIFSDGLSERSRGREDFGEERLLDLFRECASLDSRATLDRIFEELRLFGGSSPWEDDVSALVIRALDS
ncbi:MAG: PP2C family protein-serine/threonine phosphatase [Candidatus Krumholzibacteria bacterium]|nr:PP2C family protein-serine/threonine phosphatase [Candidatus Krumholzibacteria bacterium]MDP6797682.1 PP2C family protein-serine/threonine phosphatase [Candidatus Krumholzibacteria bacterium]MDP7022119.1 PP2C family protein-serine/threonine phosphatase [Candidatus Krumholzibacteria bacterium]